MSQYDKKVCKIDDDRIAGYTNRTRSGPTQVFYTGSDERDFKRYKSEGGGGSANVEMHDKPDTIRIQPPEKHYYSKLIDGEWWWVNGCAECNNQPRDWMTYVECDKHNVCRTCKTPTAEITTARWGGKNGWQCGTCNDAEAEALKQERLEAVASKEYDVWDYRCNDNVVCPHCESSYEPDCETPEGNETCEVCGGEYSVEPDYSVTYSTEVVGERIKA